MTGTLVVVRGAGDLATGCILRLVRSGFSVAALEAPEPSAIRRTVCLSEAMYEGNAQVEGLRALRVQSLEELRAALDAFGPEGPVPILADTEASTVPHLRPLALVDAILAKRNLGTRMNMAGIVVALGPGFEAGVDAHAVVETNRGHDLGRVILSGRAQANTGIPGLVGGAAAQRVLHAPSAGEVENLKRIGDRVEAGEPILAILGAEGRILLAPSIGGTLRGLIRPGFRAWKGLKVADVDPRCVKEHCLSVSDKARAIGGGVLEAILSLGGRP